MSDHTTTCQICRSTTRPVRYVSKRTQICQWCVSFLCKKPVDPNIATKTIYDYVKQYAESQLQMEIDSKVPSLSVIKKDVLDNHDGRLIANTFWTRLFKSRKLDAQQALILTEVDAKHKKAIELATPSNMEEVLATMYDLILADIVARQKVPVFIKSKVVAKRKYYGISFKKIACKESASPTQLKNFNSIFYNLIAGNTKVKRLSSDEWHDVRKDIRSQDGNKCCVCGARSRDRMLHVHHIIPLSKYGSNHVNNLITLCDSCHQKAHPDIEGIKTLIQKPPKLKITPPLVRECAKPETVKQETVEQTQARVALKDAVILHGLEVTDNSDLLRHVLQKSCPECKLNIDSIMLALNVNVPHRLLISKQSYSNTVGRLAADLGSKCDLPFDSIEWAVKSWGEALGIAGADDTGSIPLYQLFLDAKAFESTWESDQALGVYTVILDAIPTSLAALVARGRLYSLLGNYTEAISDFDSALDIHATDHNIFFYRGRAFDLLGNKAQAIEDYEDALLLNPNNAIVYNLKGLAHSYLGESENAVSSYTKAIEISPSPTLYLNLGYERYLQGECEDAIRQFNRVISLQPTLLNFRSCRNSITYCIY